MALRDFLLLMMVCLIWATNNIVSKYAVSVLNAPPLFYAAIRFVIVFLAVFPWLLPAPKPLGRIIVIAVLMGGGSFALVFVGLKTATPSAGAVVGQIGVPITTLLSFLLLGERMSLRRAIGVGMTLAGALVVIWDPHGVKFSTGLLSIAAAALAGSVGSVLMKRVETLRPLQLQAWVGLSSIPPLLAASAVFEQDQLKATLAGGWPMAAAVLYSALVVSVLAHTVYYVLIRRYEANLIAPLTLMTPLATIALGVLILQDPFGPRMALGASLALVGVLVIVARPNLLAAKLQSMRRGD
ncbi:MAG: DMT family transporter [Phenylobacterium sp.]|uniref:DMT family transporter n=1 Tax=Phenylobacterium sp. TaxID=1871053 RepID=UPI0027367FC3|nr:DMT family transporter [Phenylobacterium sp.]MDP3175825.1 DMT family transporter [Phenylobacterium sp.]